MFVKYFLHSIFELHRIRELLKRSCKTFRNN
jgi:hypothetical protein